MSGLAFKKISLVSAGLLFIAACITDLALLYYGGKQIPGYNQLTSSISVLGASGSPVSRLMSVWSVILGIFFVLFGIEFRVVFDSSPKEVRQASFLIILYGLGEGVASGIFKFDHVVGTFNLSALVHNILGGIGVISLLLLPFVMKKIFSVASYPTFHHISNLIWLIGIVAILFFTFRIDYFNNTFLNTYKGLWQRIFLVNYYVYFCVISILMIQKIKLKT